MKERKRVETALPVTYQYFIEAFGTNGMQKIWKEKKNFDRATINLPDCYNAFYLKAFTDAKTVLA